MQMGGGVFGGLSSSLGSWIFGGPSELGLASWIWPQATTGSLTPGYALSSDLGAEIKFDVTPCWDYRELDLDRGHQGGHLDKKIRQIHPVLLPGTYICPALVRSLGVFSRT